MDDEDRVFRWVVIIAAIILAIVIGMGVYLAKSDL